MKVMAENLFTGPIAEEYNILKKICPAAATMSQLVGEAVSLWNPGISSEIPKALEIGTGTGITTIHLLNANAAFHLTSLDYSGTMIEQARTNLAKIPGSDRLQLIESDALSHLNQMDSHSVDLVASGYSLHNFMDNYREKVLEEIFRVLKPGGLFINGDRYALEDPELQLQEIQKELREWFRILMEMNRPDILEEWVVHLASDESPHHIMRLDDALTTMERIGFTDIQVNNRTGVNALVIGVKPCR